MQDHLNVVMMGASGAVGEQVLNRLLELPRIESVVLLDRRKIAREAHAKLSAHIVELENPASYSEFLKGKDAAICTVGVGDPNTVEDEAFRRIDYDIPLRFAEACKLAGIAHFEMLTSIAADSASKSLYVRTKGELEEALRGIGFARLSLFKPAMILTPQPRYGAGVETALAIWPYLKPILIGRLRKLRGIAVAELGASFAENLLVAGQPVEELVWDDFKRLVG